MQFERSARATQPEGAETFGGGSVMQAFLTRETARTVDPDARDSAPDIIAALEWVETDADLHRWLAVTLAPRLRAPNLLLSLGEFDSNRAWRQRTAIEHAFPAQVRGALLGGAANALGAMIEQWRKRRTPIMASVPHPQLDRQSADRDSECGGPDRLTPCSCPIAYRVQLHGGMEPAETKGILLLVAHPEYCSAPPEPCEALHELDFVLPRLYGKAAGILLRGRRFTDRPQAPERAQDLARLTNAEMEVLAWIAKGKSNWEIAKILGRAKNTVKNQVSAILLKMRVGSRSEASDRYRQDSIC